MGAADCTLLRKVGDKVYPLWTLCSLCRICSIKFKDQMGSPELQPVFNRNVSIKCPSWKAQRDKNVDFLVSFTKDSQQMLGLRLDGKRDSVTCALLTIGILAGGVAGKLQSILQHQLKNWICGAAQSKDPGTLDVTSQILVWMQCIFVNMALIGAITQKLPLTQPIAFPVC